MDVSRQKKTKTLFDLFSDLIHFLKMPQILYNDSYENIDECRAVSAARQSAAVQDRARQGVRMLLRINSALRKDF